MTGCESCPCARIGRAILFWALYASAFPFLFPLWVMLLLIVKHDMKATNKRISLAAYDVLFQKWTLHHSGEREDELTEKILANGPPGIAYLKDLPHVSRLIIYYSIIEPCLFISKITGYVPDFMKIGTCHGWASSIYTQRIGAIDHIIEEADKNKEIEQFLVIGAGWDFRSYALKKKNPKTSCIEIDTQNSQDLKLSSCKAAKIDYDGVTMIPMNIKNVGDLNQLRSRIDLNKRTLILMEGVSYFMLPQVVGGVVELLAELPSGSSLVADFMINRPRCMKFFCCRPGLAVFKYFMNLFDEPINFQLDADQVNLKPIVKAFVDLHGGSKLDFVYFQELYHGALFRLKK